jgi:hypothetical protein
VALVEFARDELTRAGLFDKDSDYGGMLGDAIMKMVEVFAAEGHSGFSANMAIDIFSKIARFKPLTPLTGEESEWMCGHAEDGLCQNIRFSSVFKRKDGKPYDIDNPEWDGSFPYAVK